MYISIARTIDRSGKNQHRKHNNETFIVEKVL